MRETLQQRRWVPLEVWVSDALESDAREDVVETARELHVPLERKPHEELTRRCGSLEHQGLMAKMPPYPYSPLEQIVEGPPGPPLILVLDRIQDPHNFGAMIRSAEVFGASGVLIGTGSQCGVTASVVRSSAGAINHVRVARVDDLAGALGEISQRAIRVVAATGDAEPAIVDVDFSLPTAIVIGNEGVGVAPELRAACDDIVRIPQFGRVGSLNAAVAAGILLYEARRQRTPFRHG